MANSMIPIPVSDSDSKLDFKTRIVLESGELVAQLSVSDGNGNPLAFLAPALERASVVNIQNHRFVVDHCELHVTKTELILELVVILPAG